MSFNYPPCAVMCDSTDSLLFWYDFEVVYAPGNHLLFQNDCPYRTEAKSTAAIQSLIDASKYFIVQSTIDTLNCQSSKNQKRLSYFEIDMRLNGGRGGVTDTNATLIYPALCSKVTMLKQANNKDYWVIARTQDTLLVIPYTSAGFGSAKKFIYRGNSAGNILASNDGKMIVECCGHYLFSYSFNNQTGEIVSQVLMDSSSSTLDITFGDVAFSANDSFIYTIDGEHSSLLRKIFQYGRYTFAKTNLSYTVRPNSNIGNYSAIQLAPNGKIYFTDLYSTTKFLSDTPKLGEIAYPDEMGQACGLKHNVFAFNTGSFSHSDGGIIGFPFSIFDPHQVKFNTLYQCKNVLFQNVSDSSYSRFTWYFGDGDSLVSNAHTILHNYTSYGKYFVRLKGLNRAGGLRWFSDSITWQNFMPQVSFSVVDSIGCQYDHTLFHSKIITDSVNSITGATWNWNFGDGTQELSRDSIINHRFIDTGLFIVRLVYNNGFCSDTVTRNNIIRIISAPKPGFSVSDSIGCSPLTVRIIPQTLGAITHTQYDFGNGMHDTISSPSVTYQTSGNYKILQQLTGPTGCVTEDSAAIHVRPVFKTTDSTDVSDATVGNDNIVQITWRAWPGASVYDLYRHSDQDTASTLITQASKNSYSDSAVNTAAHSYTYSLLASDSCGNITGRGRIGKTIKLNAALDGNLNPQLNWNSYKDWQGGVKTYNIYRKNPDSLFALIGSTKDTIYTDQAFISSPFYNACYRVEALAKDTPVVSASNIYCMGNSPQVFIPDVFTPNGDTLNDYFAPVVSGIKSWSMVIFSRWGATVYKVAVSAAVPPLGGKGWDGNFKGTPANDGVYVYDLAATDYNGNVIKKQGTVTLVR